MGEKDLIFLSNSAGAPHKAVYRESGHLAGGYTVMVDGSSVPGNGGCKRRRKTRDLLFLSYLKGLFTLPISVPFLTYLALSSCLFLPTTGQCALPLTIPLKNSFALLQMSCQKSENAGLLRRKKPRRLAWQLMPASRPKNRPAGRNASFDCSSWARASPVSVYLPNLFLPLTLGSSR